MAECDGDRVERRDCHVHDIVCIEPLWIVLARTIHAGALVRHGHELVAALVGRILGDRRSVFVPVHGTSSSIQFGECALFWPQQQQQV